VVDVAAELLDPRGERAIGLGGANQQPLPSLGRARGRGGEGQREGQDGQERGKTHAASHMGGLLFSFLVLDGEHW
jgi:hypothetical protein